MTVYGHDRVRASLKTYWPTISLFVGPKSVGKWATAEELRKAHNVPKEDVFRAHKLTTQSMDELETFSSTSPISGYLKVAIVDATGSSSSAQSRLAGIISRSEELSNKIKYIAIADNWSYVLRAVATEYKFGLLSEDELAAVLVDRYDYSVDSAKELAASSPGQVEVALNLVDQKEYIDIVRVALKALRTKDSDLLDTVAVRWTDEATSLLAKWCNEAISGRWRVFSPEDAVASKRLPLLTLMATRISVRPRLVVRSQLMTVLRGT
jgi:hypothetical protein